ncbi:putative coatomer gamma subunit [Leptomonas pyrrhocoris]|uniref:Coatomer subunit gamma n=1 Tax=Leptomonas pyrrhocoris TaxID=157538 RepID=A0A0M9G8X1_LEPPY|nr:putative coatomer gamma subunit [Leptomonas pyrrhocoris]KPA85133.1 putative coatomer gamma subunit [Leptomonas pyrrhocoris]|eukprot:XP_015663572.1 putative coatomer gamma subunit [Leptomonas pyrrhocoris]
MENGSRFDEDEEEEVLPFEGLDKASALQECRVFNNTPLDEERSIQAMTQVLYLMSIGVRLTEAEATDVFFMSTKLMQSNHAKLRRLQYILMKELSPLVGESFMASNALMTDIKKKGDPDKSCAIRALYSVMDSSMYNSMDRTIVECMTSRNPNVVTAALVTGIHMSHTQPEMPRKWATQLNEVMRERAKAQYPAIALLHKIRNNDRLSVDRLIEDATTGRIRSSLAVCLVIKMCTELMQDDFSSSLGIYTFVVSMLHRSDMTAFEAAKSICSLRNVSDKELTPVVTMLQLYLSSQNPVLRFAAVFLISRISTAHPAAVAPINAELESLTLDSNRIIVTLAITCLLKTGTEGTIERLLTQLSSGSYMSDLGDELKLTIVDAMRVLNAKFPNKYETLLAFLFRALSDEGSSSLKQSVVDAMLDISKSNPNSNEVVLTHLAEFIDDCEFSQITKRVLMHLGEEVPNCANPRRFVRYVYNNATLEKPDVRAVAVTTLAKIAASVPTLRRSIVALLKRSCSDFDDEVRDRAVLYTKLFLHNDEVLVRTYVHDVAEAVSRHRQVVRSAQKAELTVGGGTTEGDVMAAALVASTNSASAGGLPLATPAILQGRDALRHVKQLRELGEPAKSTEPLLLTDADNEYVVSVTKHAYPAHLVLQFKVKNMMDALLFRNVLVVTDTEELEAEPLYAVPIESINPGETQYGYVVLRYEPGEFPSGEVRTTFRFSMAEAGEEGTPEDQDEYPMESFDVDVSDFISPINLGSEMDGKWKGQEANETAGTFALHSMKNLTEAAQQLASFFGMYIEGGVPEKITTASHVLRMAGVLADEAHTLVLVQAKVFIATDNRVALQLALRGGSAEVREYLANALLG